MFGVLCCDYVCVYCVFMDNSSALKVPGGCLLTHGVAVSYVIDVGLRPDSKSELQICNCFYFDLHGCFDASSSNSLMVLVIVELLNDRSRWSCW